MPDDIPSCNRCGEIYKLRPDCEPTPECDSCAQLALAELRAFARPFANPTFAQQHLGHQQAQRQRLAALLG